MLVFYVKVFNFVLVYPLLHVVVFYGLVFFDREPRVQLNVFILPSKVKHLELLLGFSVGIVTHCQALCM